MDTAMPIGFFENTREIYAEVASYTVLPPEKIKQYWNAYTTTFRRLFDPSAFRLENFWWHVWGSEKLRNLSGPTLARLFEEFSNGPTFVPLSPAQRYNGSKTRDSSRHRMAEQVPAPARPRRENSGQESSTSSDTRKAPTPSSSRPPPPHPILKKSRGPSASGRRPTARFASPPTSDDVAGHGGEVASSSTAAATSDMPPPPLPSSAKSKRPAGPTTTSPVINPTPLPSLAQCTSSPAPVPTVSDPEMRPPPPGPAPRTEKSTAVGGRKIVASNPASRRKPVMVRRPSSQSSTGSEPGSRVAGFVTAARRSGSKRPTSTASQLLGQGSLSPRVSDSGISAKAARKRPPNVATNQRSGSGSAPAQPNGHPDEPAVVQLPQALGPQRRSTWDARDSLTSQQVTPGRQAPRVASQTPAQAFPPIAGFVVDQTPGHGASLMVRSCSSNTEGQHRFREPGVALLPSQPTSSVATSTTTALGQFDSTMVTAEPTVPEARDIPDQVRFSSQAPSSALESKLKPTPPNPTPPIPFGRSKSELTVLLERGKPQMGEGP